MHESNVDGRRDPVEPLRAARLLARVPRPKPRRRMPRRYVAKNGRRFGEHPVAIDERWHAGLRIDAQILGAVLLVGREIHARKLVARTNLLEHDVRGERARAGRIVKLDHASLPAVSRWRG